MKKIILCLTILFISGCASGPVLYPNAHLKSVGEEQAHQDIAACEALANQYVKSNAGLETAKSTAIGAVGGAVVGGAVGAVSGRTGRGALTGGVAGAAGGLVHGIVKASQPTPVFKNFVNRCLKEKGYEPIGWE